MRFFWPGRGAAAAAAFKGCFLTDFALAVADAPPDFALLVIFNEAKGKAEVIFKGKCVQGYLCQNSEALDKGARRGVARELAWRF